MMSKEFIVLILAAIIVSLPIACWLTSEWLIEFPLRISLGAWLVDYCKLPDTKDCE